MPTYQYACKACDHRFEAVQKFTDDALTVCPECNGTLRKVYSSVGVVFKGSGFYHNDSRSNASTAGTSEKTSNPAEASSSTSSSDKSGSAKSDAASGSSSSSKSSSSGSSSSSTTKSAAGAAAASS